ncbi:MAG TPA: hypothetical protein VJ748_01400 [Vitreimonas sp.]|nr:hypothetical protein [Vitreimonas sp.]
MYQSLDPARIIQTLERLQARIEKRFPESGLSRVCAELTATARQTARRAAEIAAHNWPLRISVSIVILAGIIGLLSALRYFHLEDTEADVGLLQSLEAAVNLLILVGGATWFLIGLDDRLKRQRALDQLHTLRSMAHVVDMHQLTKDPHAQTDPSALSGNDLTRYLDYCAEMLALIAKLAALYAERMRDSVVIDAVTEIENLTTGLSRKIWQKITLIGALDERSARGA